MTNLTILPAFRRVGLIRFSVSILLATVFIVSNAAAEKLVPEFRGGNVRREPVAAARHVKSPVVAIACAKGGTLIFWDLDKQEIKQEFAVGQELRAVVAVGVDEFLLLDSKSHELIQVRHDGERLTELHRYPLPASPAGISVVYLPEETQIAVTSLWARQVTIWKSSYRKAKPTSLGELELLRTVDLPFEPRLIAYGQPHNIRIDPDKTGTWQVADAFGGFLAEIELRSGKVRTWQNSVHNIGGLIHDKMFDRFYVAHLRLNSLLPITAASLTSGELLQNQLSIADRRMPLKEAEVVRSWDFSLAEPESFPDPLKRRPQLELKADPAGIAQLEPVSLVCLAGTDEVAILDRNERFVKRLPAGKRPRTVLALGDFRALILGELDDSVTIVDATMAKLEQDLPRIKATTYLLDPRSETRELSPAERGERLFFSAKISAAQRMSCHSCHTDGHTNGLLADTLGDNTHGTPKRILTLRGTRLTDLWAWNGEMKTLQDNVHKSLQDTLHAPEIKPADVDDIVSFLHTLPPVPPLKPTPRDDADKQQVERGRKIFFRAACDRCHVPPLTYTSHANYDVGLADEKGLRKFNPPSLRGVGRLRGLLHDNRASSLRDVFETHGHQLTEPLPAEELADLIRFLESL